MSLPRPIASLSFSHIGIFVTDIDRMERFYTTVLGLLVTDRGDMPTGRLVFMSREPTEHHQVVLCTGRPADLGFTTVNQLSFRLGTLDDLRAAHALLKEAGATEIKPINHGISWSVYAEDPEGNRVELFVDTPWYVPQPLRDPLDLDRPDDVIYRESEAAMVVDPGYKPMAQWQEETRQRIAAQLAR